MSPRSSLLRSDRLTASLQSLSTGTLAFGLVASLAATSASAETLMTWGSNQYGAAGVGSVDPFVFTPTPVLDMGQAVFAATGGAHTMAIDANGALYAWGLNYAGAFGDGTSTGAAANPLTASNLTSGVSMASGGLYHSVALVNGGVYGFGFNTNGQLGPTSGAITEPSLINGWESGVSAISSGRTFVFGLVDGALYGIGDNTAASLGDGNYGNGFDTNAPILITGLDSGVTAFDAGSQHGVAVKDGAVYAWGYNSFAQAGAASDDVVVTTPTLVTGLETGFVSVAGGKEHSLALSEDGTVYAWGRNNYGQLGDGTTDTWDFGIESPVEVDGITGTIVAITAGNNASYALDADGSLWVWGDNKFGQLGLGDTDGLGADADEFFASPQHILAPEGMAYSFIDAGSSSNTVVAGLVPEPTTGLVVAGLGGLVLTRRRRRQA